jgi:predicted Zn-dependent protease
VELLGDNAELFRICAIGAERPNTGTVINRDTYQNCALVALASQHDAKGARDWRSNMPPIEAPANNTRGAHQRLRAFVALGDWQAVSALEPEAEKTFLTYTPNWDLNVWFGRALRPMLALAKAQLGDLQGAQALIEKSPADCYNCVRYRARIAATAKQWGRADYWFARAVHDAPSIPFAYTDWGQTLLARGKADAAVVQFKLANQKGPHFADPLEGWGEALMAKNQSHLALAKFAEAEKYAPNWGRLHLKWGEALLYAGRKDEAKAQFARATQLDLTPADKGALARQSPHV